MDERFTPRMFVEWWAREQARTVKDFGVTETVVVSWHLTPIQALAQEVGANIPKDCFYGKRYPLYTGQVDGRDVSFVYLPVWGSRNYDDDGGDDRMRSPSLSRIRVLWKSS